VHVTWLLCDALVNVSRDGQRIEPGLAESWALAPDGSQVTFKLRPGVVFHDGTPLDAAAVKASFERQFDPASPLYTSTPRNTKETLLRGLIADIRVIDPVTVIFKLKYPGLHYFSQVDVVSPGALQRAGQEFGRRPACSGPFTLDSWTADEIVLTANERYWAGRPRVDRVVFRILSEPKVTVEALIKGSVDYAANVGDFVYLERLREAPGVHLVPVSGLNVYYLGFYTERPPLKNPDVRRAIVRAINVPRLVTFIGRGVAVPAHGPLPPAVKSYDAGAAQPSYDGVLAREALVNAGYASGLKIRLLHNDAIAREAETAAAIQHELGRVGITVELVGKPGYADFGRALRAREGDAFLYSWHIRAPYPERLLMPLFHSSSIGATNFTGYSNPAVDRALDEAVKLPDGPEQQRTFATIQKLVVADAPMVFLYHWTRMTGVGARVQGLELNLGALPQDKLLRTERR
jgi:peptide/nickel transport system substrate-binding protein